MADMVRDASFAGSEFRANFKEIVAKRPDLLQIDGGRMVPPSSGTVAYQPGQVLGIVTASGLLAPYASANTDGSQVAVGVLMEYAEIDANGDGSEVVVIKGGACLYKDLLIGYDATAKTALGAKESVEHGVNLVRF